jgi:predicted nucleic acid-binding protein
MNRAVFVDASAWISFLNEKDNNHQVAMETFSRLIDEGARLITSNWTAYEALG